MKLFDRDLWNEVWETHRRNKKRSIITALGVFWGIFILIILLALSAGFSNGIAYLTRSVSTNGAVFWAQSTTLPYKGFNQGRSWSIESKDLPIIKRALPELTLIVGASSTYGFGDENVVYQDQKTAASIRGITEDYFLANRMSVLSGRLLNLQDHRDLRKYCVLGKKISSRLFGEDHTQAIGKNIKANNAYYTVVGVVQNPSSTVNVGGDPDQSLFLPYSVLNVVENKGGKLDQMVIDIRPGLDNSRVVEQVELLLKGLHQINPKDKGAVGGFDFSKIFKTFESLNLGISILVWLVGIGTLLTGAVGISNILLVTVRERTQEIGVRRALGAKPRSIILQLLLEATSLTTLAGLIGIVLGVGVTSILASFFPAGGMSSEGEAIPFVNPTVDLSIVLLALTIIISAGLLAGLLPALKAVEIKAIEAIREE